MFAELIAEQSSVAIKDNAHSIILNELLNLKSAIMTVFLLFCFF